MNSHECKNLKNYNKIVDKYIETNVSSVKWFSDDNKNIYLDTLRLYPFLRLNTAESDPFYFLGYQLKFSGHLIE